MVELLSMVILVALIYAIPLVLVIMAFRVLGTIVSGLRALNATTLRIADAVDRLASSGNNPAE